MTSKLTIYNGALAILGEMPLTALTDNRAARRHLDSAWDGGFLDGILEAGMWNFATRSTERTSSPSVTPGFGYQYAFEHPSDFVRTVALCVDDRYRTPLLEYVDEGGFFLCDMETIYLRYVSNDADYGLNYALWPESFARFAEADLAFRAAMAITSSDDKVQRAEVQRKRRLSDALAKDAMAQSTKFAPVGSWVRSRNIAWPKSKRAA